MGPGESTVGFLRSWGKPSTSSTLCPHTLTSARLLTQRQTSRGLGHDPAESDRHLSPRPRLSLLAGCDRNTEEQAQMEYVLHHTVKSELQSGNCCSALPIVLPSRTKSRGTESQPVRRYGLAFRSLPVIFAEAVRWTGSQLYHPDPLCSWASIRYKSSAFLTIGRPEAQPCPTCCYPADVGSLKSSCLQASASTCRESARVLGVGECRDEGERSRDCLLGCFVLLLKAGSLY